MTQICRIPFLLGVAWPAFGQSNYGLCDVNHDGAINVLDAQAMIGQALGSAAAANDLTGDGVVNIVDVQSEINAILYGCRIIQSHPDSQSLPFPC